MNNQCLDTKFWKVGKIVVVIDSQGHKEAIRTIITKVGKRYVTALGKRFYVMGTDLPKEIGSGKMENPLVLYTLEQIHELAYIKEVQAELLKLVMSDRLLQIGDVLGIERPEHLKKV